MELMPGIKIKPRSCFLLSCIGIITTGCFVTKNKERFSVIFRGLYKSGFVFSVIEVLCIYKQNKDLLLECFIHYTALSFRVAISIHIIT